MDISVVCIIVLVILWLRWQIVCENRAERGRAITRMNDKARVQEMLANRQTEYRQGATPSSSGRRGSEALNKPVPAGMIRKRRNVGPTLLSVPVADIKDSIPNKVVNIAADPTDVSWFLCTHKDLPAPSTAESLIIDQLSMYNIVWHREVSFKGLQFTPYSHPRFDFFLPSLNTVIEYDGVSSHSNDVQIATDKAKDKFCNDNGITIIRYNRLHYYNMYGHINSLMKEHGIKKKSK